MDVLTIKTYNKEAEKISNQHDRLAPKRLYELVLKFFIPNRKTLDIGCGSGRDTAWLATNGFDAMGIDASFGMLEQARKRYPELTFQQIALPDLAGVSDGSYSNVLCSAVLMHLEHGSLKAAVKNILRILSQGGILLLSFRGTRNANKRENGKLYETITKEEAIDLFEKEGGELLFYESILEVGRNHLWHTFVFKK
ncbi:methyltransferase type 11 [Methylocaldum marinum]|uniref:Methyltransferase type 11 n=1 Tax=Methylocaldum marinum TaxID=1432792 RepID=A0A250KWM7_9GAMM|nr:class I SAM-dependent methyltransferase [Methylocaldum marinum]BBA35371.1 methyltransferase type 11 [Methylocaldum marinum]